MSDTDQVQTDQVQAKNPSRALREIGGELATLGEQLCSELRPGHCDYISKRDAAAWIKALAQRLDGLAGGLAVAV